MKRLALIIGIFSFLAIFRQPVFAACFTKTFPTCSLTEPKECATPSGNLCCKDQAECTAINSTWPSTGCKTKTGLLCDPRQPYGCSTAVNDFCCPDVASCYAIRLKVGNSQANNNVCNYAGTQAQIDTCNDCFNNKNGAWTAIGCIKTKPSDFIATLLRFGIGIGGGIALLLIVLGGFRMMTSRGNPEQLSEGKELVGSAIAGLLMIIFSIFLLRLIGYTILGIPGFG